VKTNVYIDAFNLYYGALRRTAHRWLDINALARHLLPNHQINRIRYFTARVTVTPGDGDGRQPQRQQFYLRALRTLPNVEIHLGTFLSHPTMMPLATPSAGQKFVEVIKTEEKGSDVNLATYLLLDAFKDDYEQALVISNDSDLATPIEVVNKKLGKAVGVALPCSNPGRKPSVQLKHVARFIKNIRPTSRHLSVSCRPDGC
jgi:hypothetical protein